jgi:hypothetical protein
MTLFCRIERHGSMEELDFKCQDFELIYAKLSITLVTFGQFAGTFGEVILRVPGLVLRIGRLV